MAVSVYVCVRVYVCVGVYVCTDCASLIYSMAGSQKRCVLAIHRGGSPFCRRRKKEICVGHTQKPGSNVFAFRERGAGGWMNVWCVNKHMKIHPF